MKLNPKIKDAISVSVWAILTMANLIAHIWTQENTYGFLMLFCLVWFLFEDREYREKYPGKQEPKKE